MGVAVSLQLMELPTKHRQIGPLLGFGNRVIKYKHLATPDLCRRRRKKTYQQALSSVLQRKKVEDKE